MLSNRAKNFNPSPTLALAAKANELKSQGRDIISLTVGEPDWSTFPTACAAGVAAINEGFTRYTPASGIPDLKTEINILQKELLDISYDKSEVTVTSGAKYLFFVACQALLDAGDELIIPAPYWASYPEMARLAGVEPKIVKTKKSNHFKLTVKDLEEHLTPKTKAVLLNSPSNPTGVEYSRDELMALAVFLEANPSIKVISDDIYNQLSFNETGISPHLLHVKPSLKDRILCINGMSKAYAMTGWRIGWANGNKDVIKAMSSYQSQTVGAASAISQKASVAAIRDCKQDVVRTRETLKQRYAKAVKIFEAIPGVEVTPAGGAFYLWLDVENILKAKSLAGSSDLANILVDEYGVVAVPGESFGDPNFLRISYAIDEKQLILAAERMTKAFS